MSRFASIVAVLVASAACAGCGGSAAGNKPSVPQSKPGNDTKHVEPEIYEETTPTNEITNVDQAQQLLDQSMQTFDASHDDCATMCKALASMKRAADHLCKLLPTGEGSAKRCIWARRRVEEAETKVNSTCGGCG